MLIPVNEIYYYAYYVYKGQQFQCNNTGRRIYQWRNSFFHCFYLKHHFCKILKLLSTGVFFFKTKKKMQKKKKQNREQRNINFLQFQ